MSHKQLKIQYVQERTDYLPTKVFVIINGTTIQLRTETEAFYLIINPHTWGVLSNKYNPSLEFPTMYSVKY